MNALLGAAVAALVAAGLVPAVRRLAVRVGAVDLPGGRKIHAQPTPRWGGLAVVAGFGVGLAAWALLGGPPAWDRLLVPLVGGAAVFAAGLRDDVRPLAPGPKFAAQTLAALWALAFGWGFQQISLFGTTWTLPPALAALLTVLWIVGVTNAFNLVDGLDGLAAGVGLISAIGMAAVFALLGDTDNAAVLLVFAGALLGFLPFNFHPAKIFLGDSGSLVVGYVLAVSALGGSRRGASALAVGVPLLAFGVPILDTLLAMGRRFLGAWAESGGPGRPLVDRLRAARRMFEADRDHVHHRLLAQGLTHRGAVLTLYAVATTGVVLALLSVLARYRNVGLVLVALGVSVYVGLRQLGYRNPLELRAAQLLAWYEQRGLPRRFFWSVVDVALASAAYWGAFLIKFDGGAWRPEWSVYARGFPAVLALQVGVFALFGLQRTVWRATNVGDALRWALATLVAASVGAAAAMALEDRAGQATFFLLDGLLLLVLGLGVRSAYRVLAYLAQADDPRARPVLLYGAGHGGRLVLRELRQNPAWRMRAVGFVDDDPRLWGSEVNGLKVLGPSSRVAEFMARTGATAVVVTTDKIPVARVEGLRARLPEVAIGWLRLRWEPLVLEPAPRSEAARADR